MTRPPAAFNNFRTGFDKVFRRNVIGNNKRKKWVQLTDVLLECFASLSPKCRDEELEDLIYFVLDLYQLHGINIALSEIDMDLLAVELRTMMEEYHAENRRRVQKTKDPHMFLVLDKNLQGIPWESLPILRGQSISRIPSMSFLLDRLHLSRVQQELRGIVSGKSPLPPDRITIDPRKTYYVLNPGGDLVKSVERFGGWFQEMRKPGVNWEGLVNTAPSELQLAGALEKNDLFMSVISISPSQGLILMQILRAWRRRAVYSKSENQKSTPMRCSDAFWLLVGPLEGHG